MEQENVLHAVLGNWASSRGEGEVSWFFSSCGGYVGIFSCYGGNGLSKLVLLQGHQDYCLVMMYTSGICLRLGRAIGMLFYVRQETQGHFAVAIMVLEFLSIFKESGINNF